MNYKTEKTLSILQNIKNIKESNKQARKNGGGYNVEYNEYAPYPYGINDGDIEKAIEDIGKEEVSKYL